MAHDLLVTGQRGAGSQVVELTHKPGDRRQTLIG